MSRVAHVAGIRPGYRSIKRLGVFLPPMSRMLVHRRLSPSIKFASTYLYTWAERVSCPRTQHNALARAQTRVARARATQVIAAS